MEKDFSPYLFGKWWIAFTTAMKLIMILLSQALSYSGQIRETEKIMPANTLSAKPTEGK